MDKCAYPLLSIVVGFPELCIKWYGEWNWTTATTAHTHTEKKEQQQPHHQPATISKFFKQLE